MLGWTVWLERKITSRVKNNPEHGKLSTQVRDIGDVCNEDGDGCSDDDKDEEDLFNEDGDCRRMKMRRRMLLLLTDSFYLYHAQR